MLEESESGAVEAGDVRAALAELTEWEPMRRSPRLCAFLTYIVEAALRGEDETIKAYAIAVDVFGRDESFDPQTDPIVRVQARRLRSLLEKFYRTGDARAPVRIVLPRGRYVPQFLPAGAGALAAAKMAEDDVPTEDAGAARGSPRMPARSVWVAGAIAVVVLLVSLYFWPDLARRTGSAGVAQPRTPLVIIEELENQTSDERGAPLVAGLAVELVTDLNLFPDISARYGGSAAQATATELARSQDVFVLSGVARRSSGGNLYSIVLRRAGDEAIRASFEVEVPLNQDEAAGTLQNVSTQFALRLGSPRGPLHARVRDWLEGIQTQDAVLDFYPCYAAFSAFREQRTEIDPARLEACAQRGAEQGRSEARAMLGFIVAEQGWGQGSDTAEGEALLSQGATLTEAAVDADPLSAFNWAMRGYAGFMAGDVALARGYYNSSLQLNPAMVDVTVDYAYVNALMGNWSVANPLIERAMEVEDVPPDFYYAVPALDALRNGAYTRAAALGETMATGLPELGSAVMVAAGGHLRDSNTINTYMPRLLASQRYRQLGIMPALREHISDTALLREISTGLLVAGLPLDRLAEPFE